MKKIAIFASGNGSNAEELLKHFDHSAIASVALIVSSKATAGVLERAGRWKMPAVVLTKKDFLETQHLLGILKIYEIDWIVLAGFLWHIPDYLITAFEKRMVNIHPSLLPQYGGKGMYGDKVHAAVLANAETKSGITIHWVTSGYDEGEPVLQAECPVHANDTVASLAERIHALEHLHFSRTVEELIKATV